MSTVISVSSLDASRYISSSRFTVLIDKVEGRHVVLGSIRLAGGMVPNWIADSTLRSFPFLYLRCPQLPLRYLLPDGTGAFAKLVPRDQMASSGAWTPLETQLPIPIGKKLRALDLEILNPAGEIFEFGQTVFNVTSVTPATSEFNVSEAISGDLTGKYAVVRRFGNASSAGLRTQIEAPTGIEISSNDTNGIILNIDLSGESASQYATGVTLYPFGNGAQWRRVSTIRNYKYAVITLVSRANPTEITVSGAHGMSTGDIIEITGFNNASTQLLNQQLNTSWEVTVTGINTFTIPIDTSGEPASAPVYGSGSAYSLGAGSQILIYDRQSFLDFEITYQ